MISVLSYKTLVDEVRDYNTIKLNMDDVRVQMRENLALIVPDDADAQTTAILIISSYWMSNDYELSKSG